MLGDEGPKDVKQRAVDQIMKLINSQLALERKQAKMDSKVRSYWRSSTEAFAKAPHASTDRRCSRPSRLLASCAGCGVCCGRHHTQPLSCPPPHRACCCVQDKETGKAATRMADLDETIEKLVGVAKRKGYIDAACTVASLKAEAAKSKEAEVADDAVSLMTAMKKNLDAQTTAVRNPPSIAARCQDHMGRLHNRRSEAQVTEFMKDRVNHDAEWEEAAWAKLLNSNQDILVLMGRLHERSLITQDMINMATLPDKPPPPREQDMKGVAPQLEASAPQFTPPMDGSMMAGMGGNPMYSAGSSMMGGAPPRWAAACVRLRHLCARGLREGAACRHAACGQHDAPRHERQPHARHAWRHARHDARYDAWHDAGHDAGHDARHDAERHDAQRHDA